MTGLYDFIRRMHSSQTISQHDIRAEVFALGGRHHGRVLEGARAESKAPNLPLRRAMLLRAVIRNQGG